MFRISIARISIVRISIENKELEFLSRLEMALVLLLTINYSRDRLHVKGCKTKRIQLF